MKLLVIGRSGQVARSLAEHAPSDAAVVCLGRPDVDLSAPDTLRRAVAENPADVVINAAAYTGVDKAETDEAAAHAQNAVAPGVLAEAAAAASTPFIHISTDYVFNGKSDRPYREDDPIDPSGVYGRTKAAGEQAVTSAGGRSLTVRTAWVYSPFGHNFVKTMLRLGAERDHLRVVADQHGSPTSALDLADGLIALASQHADWPPGPSILHVAGTGQATWHELAKTVLSRTSEPPVVEAITTEEFPTPAPRPANSRLDCTKAAEAFGVRLPDWRKSVDETVRRLLVDAPN